MRAQTPGQRRERALLLSLQKVQAERDAALEEGKSWAAIAETGRLALVAAKAEAEEWRTAHAKLLGEALEKGRARALADKRTALDLRILTAERDLALVRREALEDELSRLVPDRPASSWLGLGSALAYGAGVAVMASLLARARAQKTPTPTPSATGA